MFDGLVIHPKTRARLEHFASNPAHAVILVGADGVGKSALAERLIATALRIKLTQLANFSSLLHISPDDKNSISIEQIRSAHNFLQLKTIGRNSLRRAILIEHADSLTAEAQNAFLKILEEPPSDTIILLTAGSHRALLPTILSRVQTLSVHAPEAAELQAFFGNKQGRAELSQSYFLSGGLPGLMSALLSDADHPLKNSVQTAKTWLQKSPFERLATVDSIAKQRSETHNLVTALERIATAALDQATKKQSARSIAQWHNIKSQAFAARQALQANASPKLVLDNLALAI